MGCISKVLGCKHSLDIQKSSGLQSLDYYGMHLGNFTSKNCQFCKTENILIYGQKSVDFEAIWTLGFCDLPGVTV